MLIVSNKGNYFSLSKQILRKYFKETLIIKWFQIHCQIRGCPVDYLMQNSLNIAGCYKILIWLILVGKFITAIKINSN